jgi:ClpP class serine protease
MSKMWLLSKESTNQIARAYKHAVPPSAEQLKAFREAHPVRARASDPFAEFASLVAGDKNPALTIVGSTAEIAINGVLTEELDFWLWLFDIPNTSYADVREALAQIAVDPTVKNVLFSVNSPGGTVDGLFETLAAIQQFQTTTQGQKPIKTRASYACSAAYSIASQTDRIDAVNEASRFGSVGVAVDMIQFDFEYSVASTEAPKKRPDVTTDEGQAIIREQLDEVHDLFVDAIAAGRSRATKKDVSADEVNAKYGRGASLLAGEAKKQGMVDSVRTTLRSVVLGPHDDAPAVAGGAEENEPMDAKTLKTQHPDTYAAVLREGREEGDKAGREAGATAERERCTAHITMGEAGGPEGMKIAHEAIKTGEGFGPATQAKYLSVAMNRSDRNARQQESDHAGAAADGATAPANEGADDMGDKTAAALGARRGKKVA